MVLCEKEFVKVVEVLGEFLWCIIFIEILLNLILIVGVSFIGLVMYVIMMEVMIFFLGLGDLNIISWGIMFYNV